MSITQDTLNLQQIMSSIIKKTNLQKIFSKKHFEHRYTLLKNLL